MESGKVTGVWWEFVRCETLWMRKDWVTRLYAWEDMRGKEGGEEGRNVDTLTRFPHVFVVLCATGMKFNYSISSIRVLDPGELICFDPQSWI